MEEPIVDTVLKLTQSNGVFHLARRGTNFISPDWQWIVMYNYADEEVMTWSEFEDLIELHDLTVTEMVDSGRPPLRRRHG